MATQLCHLNQDVLGIVLGQLTPTELAALSCVNKEFNACIRKLGVWEGLVRAAWRYGGSASAPCLAKYNGDWRSMYCSRMALPRSFTLACDIVGTKTSAIQKESNDLGGRLPGFMLTEAFEKVARAIASVSRQVKEAASSPLTSARAIIRSRELALCKQHVAWWLHEAPQVVVAFAREARQVQQACQSGHPSRASGVEWQRQALAFCLGLALEGAHPSIGSRLERELGQLDLEASREGKESRAACMFEL